MKKILVIALTIVLCFGFAACGGSDDSSSSSQSQAETTTEATTEANVPSEYKVALESAKTYSDMMHMSKAAIYDQLTSEYGNKFPEDAAQYAVDNLKANYKQNALEAAKEYRETMNMSNEAIRDQLVSEYGNKFTQKQADWAIEHLDD